MPVFELEPVDLIGAGQKLVNFHADLLMLQVTLKERATRLTIVDPKKQFTLESAVEYLRQNS